MKWDLCDLEFHRKVFSPHADVFFMSQSSFPWLLLKSSIKLQTFDEIIGLVRKHIRKYGWKKWFYSNDHWTILLKIAINWKLQQKVLKWSSETEE